MPERATGGKPLKRAGGIVLAALVALVLAVAWVTNCSGPQPLVEQVRLLPPAQPGDPYRVLALVRNRGMGQGQVTVTLRLRAPEGGQTYQSVQQAHLRPSEASWVTADIPAPAADYTPEAEAQYPP